MTLFLGAGLLKLTSDTNKATTLREFCFCDRGDISTIVVAELATEETAYSVVLAEESSLPAQKYAQCLE